MVKRNYYIRTHKNNIGEDGDGLQMVDFDSEAKMIDWSPDSATVVEGVRGTTVGKITVELYDGHNIKKENLDKLVSLFHTCLGIEVNGKWPFDESN